MVHEYKIQEKEVLHTQVCGTLHQVRWWLLNTDCSVSEIHILILCVPWSYRLRIEKHMRAKARRASLEKKKLVKLKEMFPHMKAPAL